MIRIDCIVTQGDCLQIDTAQDIRGQKTLEISVFEGDAYEDEVRILIGKYEAEQIIEELKKQFDL